MFTPPSLSLTSLPLTAASIGFIVGVSGILASVAEAQYSIPKRRRGDGLLGSADSPSEWFAVFLIPWRNTITYYVDKTLVTSTMSHYQHPY